MPKKQNRYRKKCEKRALNAQKAESVQKKVREEGSQCPKSRTLVGCSTALQQRPIPCQVRTSTSIHVLTENIHLHKIIYIPWSP